MFVFFTAAVIRFHYVFDKSSLFGNSVLPLRCLVLSCGLNFCLCLFRMRQARAAPAADAAYGNEIGDDQSIQDEIPPAPRRRGRGRGRGRVRAAAAPQPDQLPTEPEIPAAFATDMAGINQGLAALNQAMPLVQQMLHQRDHHMTDADAALLYSRVVQGVL